MERKVALFDDEENIVLKKIEEIIYFESLGKKTKTICCEGDEYIIKESLSIVEEKLPDNIFFKIHKSFIINIDCIKGINMDNNKKVLLNNGIQLNVAHRKYREFLEFVRSRFEFW